MACMSAISASVGPADADDPVADDADADADARLDPAPPSASTPVTKARRVCSSTDAAWRSAWCKSSRNRRSASLAARERGARALGGPPWPGRTRRFCAAAALDRVVRSARTRSHDITVAETTTGGGGFESAMFDDEEVFTNRERIEM